MQKSGNDSIGAAWRWFLKSLKASYSEQERHAIGREVFRHFFGLGPAERVVEQHLPFSEKQKHTLENVIAQLKNQVPLQYITGLASFYGLDFMVNESVLIPRPETEELVQWVLDTVNNEFEGLSAKFSLLDVGTGSGCLAIALASNLPGASVSACDVSESALKLASENANKNNVAVNFFTCDVLNDDPAISDLDLVISNPPYIRESEKPLMQANVLNYEPASALFVSDDDPLVFYRTIARKAQAWLKPGGWLFFEINESLGTETKQCIEKEGFIHVELKKDINGRDRMLKAKKSRL
jgi:release factor glutamine methyltransferase